MFGASRLAACAALGLVAALFTPALAEEVSKNNAQQRLQAVPVFYVADAAGKPVLDPGATQPTYYLTRSQASLGLGMIRGETAAAGGDGESLRIVVTDLADAMDDPGVERFVKPVSTIDAADALDGVPLFIVRDKEGAPFTLKDKEGVRKVFFYLAEDDARAFIDRVIKETGRSWDDIRLSVIPLEVIVNSMNTSKDPGVKNWVIYPSADSRRDAASLQAAMLEKPKVP